MTNLQIVAAFLLVLCTAECSDVIDNLPGLSSSPNFTQYSGYLKGFYPGHKLHYWFVESQRNASEDPLVLWMNGGPGCSSLTGLLTEHGPFTIQKDAKTLVENPFSWNKIANVLYLEAPVGVGYSYIEGSQQYKTDDNRTTLDNFHAVRYFFVKYPQFRKNEFYVTGESYGGMYVPLLTAMIAESAPEINLKGFAIGNGLLDDNMNDISLYFYYFYHGFIGTKDMQAITKYCCHSSYNMRDCLFTRPNCQQTLHNVNIGRVNMYNVFQKCYPDKSTSRGLSVIEALGRHLKHFGRLGHPVIPCIDMSFVNEYMNKKEVRAALNIPISLEGVKWDVCNLQVNLQYGRLYQTMKDHILSILSHSVRGMIYNGDFDTACNFLGDEWFVDSLHLPPKSSKVNFYDLEDQVVGYVKRFTLLDFVTVKAAGHMVPTDQPQVAFMIFEKFLKNLPF